MKIFVTAKPRSHEDRVEQIDADHFVVSVKAPPIEGRANRAITQALADFFHVAPSLVRLTSGATSRQKVFDIL